MRSPFVSSILALTLCLSSGCVSGRRSFAVNVPPADSYSANSSKGAIAVGAVADSRHFENKPGDPSTPSINGDVNDLSPEARSKFIGRQRNGFGHAWGDIVLPAGQTVQEKVADLIREGLKRRGFEVVDPSATGNSATGDIEEFWSWITPGFFALSFEAQIKCKVTVTRDGKTTTIVVKGYGLNHGQFAKDVNWQEAYDIAVQDFLTNLNEQLDAAGL
jgi:hypothetical protein